MKSTQRFSVLIWADKRKTDANGNVPLYARITYLGKRVEISLQRKIDPKKWDAQAGFLKGPGQDIKNVNAVIAEASNEIRLAYDDLKRTDEFISADKIKQQYTGEGIVHRMLLEVFDEHNKNLEALVGKDYVKATLTKYNTVRSKTADYILSRPDITCRF